MKNILNFLVFLFITSAIYSQEKELKSGIIITNNLDTLRVMMHVLNQPKSIILIKYLDRNGKTKRISTKEVKSYRRGNEYFKTITVPGNYKLFAKEILKGINFSLYKRVTGGESFLDPSNETIEYSSLFIENKYGMSIKVPYPKKKFSKRISKFLTEHPKISEKVKNGQLTNIREIVNLCNYIYY